MLLDVHTHHADRAQKGQGIYSLDLTQKEIPSFQTGTYYSLSIHPWTLVPSETGHSLERLHKLANNQQVIAIGEAGLDKRQGAPLPVQQAVFRQVIQLSESFHLPLIIHCVKATDELLALRRELKPASPWILHGFRGKPSLMHDLAERHGLYLSFGERYNPESLRQMPLERLCLETDESLVPIEQLLQQAATAKNLSPDQLRTQLQANYRRLFHRIQHGTSL